MRISRVTIRNRVKRSRNSRGAFWGSAAGMTLIEIVVVIAIFAVLVGVGATTLFPGDGAKLRDEVSDLAGKINFLYHEAVIKKKYFRIAFNLEEQSYKIESSGEPFAVTMEGEDASKDSRNSKTPPPETPAFVEEENYLAKPVKLASGIKIKDLWVYHASERKSQGIEHWYVFPQGWAEPMVLNFSNDDETEFFALEVNPVTGKSTIYDHYVDVNPQESASPEAAP